MHRLAEFGVAAHWTYKLLPSLEGSSSAKGEKTPEMAPSTETELVLLDRQEAELSKSMIQESSRTVDESASYIHALEESRRRNLQSHVYVFLAGSSSLETGQLLTLSAGSIVMDAIQSLRHGDSLDYEDKDLQVWKNGKLALMSEIVRNGDMLLIEPVNSASSTMVVS